MRPVMRHEQRERDYSAARVVMPPDYRDMTEIRAMGRAVVSRLIIRHLTTPVMSQRDLEY